ncbi:hypothetical protein [Jannaschia rubra]|uniref:hypothetical protein n=1 Tax=Jannaschia rubra TaxID=282197 RepID=UPI000AECC60E|nr:hypothetical protein [Jannaschia rubra]
MIHHKVGDNIHGRVSTGTMISSGADFALLSEPRHRRRAGAHQRLSWRMWGTRLLDLVVVAGVDLACGFPDHAIADGRPVRGAFRPGCLPIYMICLLA